MGNLGFVIYCRDVKLPRTVPLWNPEQILGSADICLPFSPRHHSCQCLLLIPENFHSWKEALERYYLLLPIFKYSACHHTPILCPEITLLVFAHTIIYLFYTSMQADRRGDDNEGKIVERKLVTVKAHLPFYCFAGWSQFFLTAIVFFNVKNGCLTILMDFFYHVHVNKWSKS